ncbi:MAG: AAA family ATPase [Desulfuromonadaceae bacterium]|nr:AAA family ATPase [Desulfuromonadaceae bacterium]
MEKTYPTVSQTYLPLPQRRDYGVDEVFGLNSRMSVPGYEPGHPHVPNAEPYIWSDSLARDCIEWLLDPHADPLWISGPAGCGKSACLKSLFSALNVPTVIVSAKADTEPDDILGRTQLVDGSTRFIPGPLLRAYALGYAILFDEIDAFNPETLMACHRLLERETVTLQDGRQIVPSPLVRLAATANTRGDGQGQDLYTGTRVVNGATLNRFEKWHMHYPDPDLEREILLKQLPGFDATVATAMVRTAEDIRKAYEQGHCPMPISLRDLMRWGKRLITGGRRSDVQPVYHGFDKAFGFGVEPCVRRMLHKCIETHFAIAAPELDSAA